MVAGVAVAALVVLVVLVKVLVTPERVRQTVVPLVEENLHRTLQLGAIDIGLLSGIRLNDVALLEADGKGEFVGADAVELRYRLLPLLLLKVEIDEIRLDKPRVRIDRFADGRFNFSDLTKPSTAAAEPAPAPEPPTVASPLDLHVARFDLNDGALHYRDTGVKPAVEHDVTALNVTVRDFSLRERFPLKLSADWNGNALRLEGDFDLDDLAAKATFSFNQLQLRCEGDILHEAKGERLRAKLEMPRIAVKDLVASLPKEYVTLPAGLVTGGELALAAELDGLLAEPLALLRSARLDLFSASVVSGELKPRLSGAVLLDGHKLSTDELKLDLDGEALQLLAGSADLFATPPSVDLRVTGKRFDLDRALPAPKEAGKEEGKVQPAAKAPAEEIGPLNVPLQLLGEVLIDEVVTKGLTLKPVQLKLVLRDNVLRIDSFHTGIDDGKLQMTAQADLRQNGLKYSGSTQITTLQVNPLVKAFKPSLGESLFGVVDGRIDFNGRGTLPETVKQQLSATGNLQLQDGRLTSMPVLDSTAKLLGVESLREVSLEKGQVDFVLKDGKVQIDSVAGGAKLRLTTKGTVDLDGKLDLVADAGLGPELSQQLDRSGALSRALSDKQGWTAVPLLITGSADKPKVALDSKALAKQATGKALDRLSESLQKKLAPKSDEKEASPEKQAVDSVLKGLLGR